MLRQTIARISAALVFLLFAWAAYTQNQSSALALKSVAPNLYMIEGDGGNVAVYVTGDGVVLVDDKYERDHDAIVEAVAGLTNQPIKYVINTHYHADHSGGNKWFSRMNLQIISTAQSRMNIVNRVPGNDANPFAQPANLVFTDQQSVFPGGKEVRAKFFGRGHTNGDAFVYFPEVRVVHTGDDMAGANPYIDYPGGGSLLEYTDTVDKAMKEWPFETVIPGHGAVTNRAGLQDYRNNAAKLRDQVSALVKGGKSQEEVAAFMEKEYGWRRPNSLQQLWSVPGFMIEFK